MTDDGLSATIRLLGREMVRELGVVDSASSTGEGTLTQCHVLVELERHGTLTANELAELLIVDKSAISRTVTQLLEAGMIALRCDPKDRRRKPLVLTPLGAKRASLIHDSAQTRVKEAISTLNEDDVQAVLRGMSLYVKALHRARIQKSFALRAANKVDQPVLMKLMRGVLDEFLNHVEQESDGFFDYVEFQNIFETTGARLYVIEDGGRIVGCSGLSPWQNHAGIRTCELQYLFVARDVRGAGIGRSLLQKCLDEAQILGYQRVHIEVKSNMTSAQKLIDSFGFTSVRDVRAGANAIKTLTYHKDLKEPSMSLNPRLSALSIEAS